MRVHSVTTVITLAFGAASAIPPDNFGFPNSESSTPLSVVYQANGSALIVQPGQLFGIDVPAQAPQIAVNESDSLIGDYNGTFLLLMVDPDASRPENPTNRWIIHWWQDGLRKSTSRANDTSLGGTLLENTTAARVDYRRPRPPSDSSAHRYIQYLFTEPANFQIPDAYSGYNSTNSSMFPLQQFLSDSDLNSPVSANYFYCSNETSVPVDFVAAPGSEYPGGNQGMITQGTNDPSTATSTSTSGTTSATGSSTASSSASASASAAAGNALTTERTMFSVLLSILASWTLLI